MKKIFGFLLVMSFFIQACECACEDKYKYHIHFHVHFKHNENYCTNSFTLFGERGISFIDQNGKFIKYDGGDYMYFEIANQER